MSQVSAVKSVLKTYSIFLIPFILIALYCHFYPYSQCLTERQTKLTELSSMQRSNIQVAARKLDGSVVKPGEEFSFNQVVGPRTTTRGYRYAPSYLNGENPLTEGGGICLLSSYLYQTALSSGLEITQRVPHLRTIKTVPVGLDATVWYGQADLCFKNTLDCPIMIKCMADSSQLTLKILGRPNIKRNITISRLVRNRTNTAVLVEVFLNEGKSGKLVSRDLYRLTP